MSRGGMDAYVTKPIRKQELYAAIDELVPYQPPLQPDEANAPAPDSQLEPDLNEAAILARVDGDRELLKELVNLFLQDGPKLRTELQAALAARDGKRLQRAAHTLKGIVDLFQAKAAHAAALQLEQFARDCDFSQAERAIANLEQELARLEPALAALGR